MTARVPFKQADVERAIAAAQRKGLRVTGIRPDGTVLVDESPQISVSVGAPEPSKWEDVQA